MSQFACDVCGDRSGHCDCEDLLIPIERIEALKSEIESHNDYIANTQFEALELQDAMRFSSETLRRRLQDYLAHNVRAMKIQNDRKEKALEVEKALCVARNNAQVAFDRADGYYRAFIMWREEMGVDIPQNVQAEHERLHKEFLAANELITQRISPAI